MHKLPKPSVDTGMGLERLTAVLQHVHSNYEIDLFVNLLAAAKKAVDAAGAGDCDTDSPSLKVIADHIRACAFTGGRRRDPGQRRPRLRAAPHRAPRHPPRLQAGREQALLPQAGAATWRREMGDAYPELRPNEKRVTEVLKAGGGALLRDASPTAWRSSTRALARRRASVLDGDVAFKLHDTYGFPLDLTADVCRERGVDGRRGRLRRARWTSSARRPARPASSRWRGRWSTAAARPPSTATRSWRTTAPRSSRCTSTAAPRLERGAGDDARRRARPHAVLRRERRPGRRHRRAAQRDRRASSSTTR